MLHANDIGNDGHVGIEFRYFYRPNYVAFRVHHHITVFIVSLEVDESEKPSHAQSIQRGILQTIWGIDRN